MKGKIFLLIPVLVLSFLNAWAETEGKSEVPDVMAMIKDGKGEVLEGYLRFRSEEVTVSTKDNQEKAIPAKYIKSITLEKVKEETPGKDPRLEVRYSLRVENSQEIYTLKKKYTFSLNTNLGMVTKTIDPEVINNYLFKETSQTGKLEKEEPLIQDKSIVLSVEFKY
jgi:hypothetical protein